MTTKEAQACAAETLTYFMQTMPDAPFTEDEIIIEFAPQTKMVERYKALCALYRPEQIINENQAYQLANTIAANAILGRGKSAILVCNNPQNDRIDWQLLIFHELMHIFCAKLEMDEKDHFIDIYVSGHTPDMNPDDKIYDGHLNAGYELWSEFIAQYYALKMVEQRTYKFTDVINGVANSLLDVRPDTIFNDKTALAVACAYMLTCEDAEATLENFDAQGFLFDDGIQYAVNARMALRNCVEYLHRKIQTEKPWRITESYIAELGESFIAFKTLNCLYLGVASV